MSTVSRLAGALLLETEGRAFLIGNPKEPCDFAAAGFVSPPIIDATRHPYLELLPRDPEASPPVPRATTEPRPPVPLPLRGRAGVGVLRPPLEADAIGESETPLAPSPTTEPRPPVPLPLRGRAGVGVLRPPLALTLQLEGEPAAKILADRLLISRNGSVSERLWRLILGITDDAAPPPAPVDATWLAAVPPHVWAVVRDAVLRCI